MAEQLLDVLQHALREHWQDDRVAKAMSKRSFCKRLRLQASLQCLLSSVPVAQAAGQGSTPQRVVEFRPPSASVGKGSVKESVRPSKGGAKGTGKHPLSGPRATDAKGGHTERRDSARTGKGAIVDINPQEWERSAILTTKKAILGALGEGKAPPGTVVSVGDAEDVLELRDAWKALSRYEPLTILLDQPGVESLQGINVIKARAGVRRAGSSWAVEDLRLFAIGDSQQAPFVKAARATNVRQFTPPARQTVRLVALARYRRDTQPLVEACARSHRFDEASTCAGTPRSRRLLGVRIVRLWPPPWATSLSMS